MNQLEPIVYKRLLEDCKYNSTLYQAIAELLVKEIQHDPDIDHWVLGRYIREAQFNGEAWQTSTHYKEIYKHLLKPKAKSIRDDLNDFVIGWLGSYVCYAVAARPHFMIVFDLPHKEQFNNLWEQMATYAAPLHKHGQLYSNFHFWVSYILYQEIKTQGLLEAAFEMRTLFYKDDILSARKIWVDFWLQVNQDKFATEHHLFHSAPYCLIDLNTCVAFDKKYGSNT